MSNTSEEKCFHRYIGNIRKKYGSEMSYNSITRSKKKLLIPYLWDNKILSSLLLSSNFEKIFVEEQKVLHVIYRNFFYKKLNFLEVSDINTYFKETYSQDGTAGAIVLYNYTKDDMLFDTLTTISIPIIIIRRPNDIEIENLNQYYLQESNSNIELNYTYDVLTRVKNQLIEESSFTNYDEFSFSQSTNEYKSPTIQSECQFNYLYRLTGIWRKSFENLIYLKSNKVPYEIRKCLINRIGDCLKSDDESKHSDGYIYTALAQEHRKLESENIFKEKYSEWTPEQTFYRATRRVNDVDNLLNLHDFDWGFKNMLDIGCAEGNITSLLGELFGFTKENINGCDVRDIPSEDKEKMIFKTINEDSTLPYENESIDLIFMFMTFHHIENKEKMIEEMKRILTPNGCIIIREHDSYKPPCQALLDLLHGLYSVVWSFPPEQPNYCTEFRTYYESKDKWDEFFKSHNFSRVEHINSDCDYLYEMSRRPGSYFFDYYAMYYKSDQQFLERAKGKNGKVIYTIKSNRIDYGIDDDDDEEEDNNNNNENKQEKVKIRRVEDELEPGEIPEEGVIYKSKILDDSKEENDEDDDEIDMPIKIENEENDIPPPLPPKNTINNNNINNIPPPLPPKPNSIINEEKNDIKENMEEE